MFSCYKQDENSHCPDSLSLYPLPLAGFAHTSMASRYHLFVREVSRHKEPSLLREVTSCEGVDMKSTSQDFLTTKY